MSRARAPQRHGPRKRAISFPDAARNGRMIDLADREQREHHRALALRWPKRDDPHNSMSRP
jgi:hypothetical protein